MKQSTTSIGRRAEAATAQYLSDYFKLKLLQQNWRNRYAEIDLIMQHKKTKQLHFIEVKYRQSISRGDGLAMITPKKYQQLLFAAQQYLQDFEVEQSCQIDVIAVSGESPNFSFDYRPASVETS
ncbi:YraN family protein [Candidatus Saccharibacteria bacterium]|nr:YraN family protein [Candidatus Saccharibacteria bacterium]